MTAPQIKSLLLDTRLPRLEVRMLLEHVLDKPRAWLLAHDTDALAPEVAAAYEALALRRLAGEPMAYLLGHREFMGHRFRVTPDVLIPRPDTEVLVETALDCIAGVTGPMVLDLGTGSGAIAVSIALARRDARVMASDVSAAALAVAAANAWELTAAVRFVEGSWYEAVPAGEGFDLIVSNPPYVASDDPHLDQGDLRFEPRGAFYALPSIANTGLTDAEFCEYLLHEERVAVVPGSAFGASGGGFIRASYATSTENIERALERMARFVQRRVGAAALV